MSVVGFDGTRVLLTEDRRKHIALRHPELEDKQALVLDVVASPNEVYVDAGGMFHALKKLLGEISDYVVVIYFVEDGEGYKRTAYYTSHEARAMAHNRIPKKKHQGT
jgi:hypothetical protein